MSKSAGYGNFEYEGMQACEDVVRYLRAIIEGIESGHLRLADGNNSMALKPAKLMQLRVRAKKKRDDVTLSVKLLWSKPDSDHGNDDEALVVDNAN
jgi:amphi-Trp domain-containing protein